jgi:hypothetical protein
MKNKNTTKAVQKLPRPYQTVMKIADVQKLREELKKLYDTIRDDPYISWIYNTYYSVKPISKGVKLEFDIYVRPAELHKAQWDAFGQEYKGDTYNPIGCPSKKEYDKMAQMLKRIAGKYNVICTVEPYPDVSLEILDKIETESKAYIESEYIMYEEMLNV